MSNLISFIVPVYNVENYLEECILSILNQTHQNIELLLINDGSKDRSGQICDVYAAKDSRVKVIHQENAGAAAARNTGLDACLGDYLAFIDSDDYIHDGFAADLLAILLETGSDIAVSNYYCYVQERHSYRFHHETHPDSVEVLTPQECMDYQCDVKDYVGAAMVIACAKLYKRELFTHIRFPVGYMVEDEMVTHKLFLKAKQVAFVNRTYYAYRINSTSVTQNLATLEKRVEDGILAFSIKLADLVIAGLDTGLVEQRFYYHLRRYKRELEEAGREKSRAYQGTVDYLARFHQHP